MKKVLALSLAMIMVLALCSTALAANPVTSEFLTTPSFDGTHPDTKITVTNLESGTTAQYYKLVEWQGTTVGTSEAGANGGWKLTAAAQNAGLVLADLLDGITVTEATAIANAFKNSAGTNMTVTGTTAEATVEPGMYYVKLTAAADDKDTIYNPVIVSADYYPGNNSINVSDAKLGGTSVAKKSKITFDKEVNDNVDGLQYRDVKPGDVIPYKITTNIPSYGSAYDDAKFEITDTLSNGLQLDGDISVTYGGKTVTSTEAGEVTITRTEGNAGGFKVTFNKDYLIDDGRGVTDVTITYSAKVNDKAIIKNVNPMDNTADLEYSNAPGSTSDKHDRTRHYTFSIDGEALGNDGEWTSELIKVGLDAEGHIIESMKETYHGHETSPLDGASFTLSGDGIGTGMITTSESHNGGHIEFHGLDAGTYTLVENSAPAGFVKDGRTYTITITPYYTSATSDILDYYTVTFAVDGVTTKTVSFSENTNGNVGYSEKVTTTTRENDFQDVQNRQGLELPSTGGIGTTIFYVAGLLMVLGAGTVLVARRKADQE